MKIKRLNLYTYILYIMLAAYMLGPALSFKVGVPRIDNPLTLIFVLLGFVVFFLESKHIPRKIFAMLCALTAMCIWPAIHMGITSLTPTQYMDILFFMAVPAFFYLFYQVLKRADDPLRMIQKFLVVFTLFIAVPPFAELATGIQFVSASDELAIDEGSLKGLFFNPNNLAATAVCLAPAILFFFQLQGRKHKEKLLGWGLFLLLGMAIFASVSRTAIGCYLLILLVYTAYRKNGFYYGRRRWFAGVGVVDDSITRDCGIFAVAQRQPVFGTLFQPRVPLPVRLGQRQLRFLPSGDLQLLLEQSAPAADRLRS